LRKTVVWVLVCRKLLFIVYLLFLNKQPQESIRALLLAGPFAMPEPKAFINQPCVVLISIVNHLLHKFQVVTIVAENQQASLKEAFSGFTKQPEHRR
jgi:hypothetical protein